MGNMDNKDNADNFAEHRKHIAMGLVAATVILVFGIALGVKLRKSCTKKLPLSKLPDSE